MDHDANDRSTASDAPSTRELKQRIQELETRIDDLEDQHADGLMTPEGVAQYLNVSKRTVERIIDRGRLNPLWVGGQRRFEPETVKRYVRKYGTSKDT